MSDAPEEGAPPELELVRDGDSLARCLDALWDRPRLALDTECNASHAYRGQVCVVQLCEAPREGLAHHVYLVDMLEVGPHPRLRALLAGEGPELVVHDVAFDARMLARDGLPLERAFDTALHARFLGKSHTGLGSLLTYYFGHALDKSLQAHNWAERPFTDAQLTYLADDVRWLGVLAARLEDEAAAMDIVEEVRLETEFALGQALADRREEQVPWVQVKGAHLLRVGEQAVLRELALVRDEEARARELPPGQVMAGAALLALARDHEHYTNAQELRRALRSHQDDSELVELLWAAVLEGRKGARPPDEETAQLPSPRPPPPAELTYRKAREQALMLWRKDECGARMVDPQVVLPTHVLHELARRFPRSVDALEGVPGLGAVRVRRYGETLVRVLSEPPPG